MKYLNIIILVVSVIFFYACKTTQVVTTKKQPDNVQLITQLKGCKDSLVLYEFNGLGLNKIKSFEHMPGDSFRVELPAGSPQFYYIGNKSKGLRPVILGSEKVVSINGSCNALRAAKFVNSDINKNYDALMRQVNKQTANMNRAARDFQKNIHNEKKRNTAVATMAMIDAEKSQLLDSLNRAEPYLAKIAALTTYLSFQNNNNSRYKNELEYFGRAYFEHADLKDPDYNNIPYMFEAFKNWTKTLGAQKIPKGMVQSFLDSALVQIPSDSRAHKYAMGGIVVSLQAKNHSLFPTYGKRYLEKYKDDKGPEINNLRKKVEMSGRFMKGAVAPDFTQNTPEGDPLSLSDLRGKIVLVDFWASWCGPCRKENPNVVRLYNKYKDKGFDVLGVSLDRSKQPWLKAIEKDGLPWHQISDLRGWKNKAAQLYSVSSIPHTVLLDREGRIIARNLRGAALDKELERIFGK